MAGGADADASGGASNRGGLRFRPRISGSLCATTAADGAGSAGGGGGDVVIIAVAVASAGAIATAGGVAIAAALVIAIALSGLRAIPAGPGAKLAIRVIRVPSGP